MKEILGVLLLSICVAEILSAAARDKRGLLDLGSKAIGAGIGMIGTAVYPLEETRYKCVHIMGYGYSGPDSNHPERYDNMKPESESNSIADIASRGIGMFWGTAFHTFLPDSANQEICRQIGMGYHDPQPGYPQTPGGGGPVKSNTTTNGVGSSTIYQYGSQGTPGQVFTSQVNPNQPGYYIQQNQPDTYGQVITIPGQSGSQQQVTYVQPEGQTQQVTYEQPGGQTQQVTYEQPGGQPQQVTYVQPGGQPQQVTYVQPGGQPQQVTYVQPEGQPQQVTYEQPGGQETTVVTETIPGTQGFTIEVPPGSPITKMGGQCYINIQCPA